MAQLGQAEHLEPAAVGQDRPLPTREAVQAAERGHRLVPGAQMQVVGVAEHDLRANIFEVKGRQAALDGGGGRHVHKRRGLYGAVDGSKLAAARGALLVQQAVRHIILLHQAAKRRQAKK